MPSPSIISAALRIEILGLYRSLLRNAAIYPSVKRDDFIEEIKLQFRKHASLNNKNKINKELNIAYQALQTMQQYNKMMSDKTPIQHVVLR